MKQFEEKIKNAIITSYINVMGIEKWNSLTDEEKNMVLHLVLNGFAKSIGL